MKEADQQTMIREASSCDAADAVGLIRILAQSDGEESPVNEEYVREFLSFPGSGILLACAGDRALGLLSYSMRPNLYHASRSCLIEELVVDESARGRGIGGALVEAVMQKAAAAGCAEISVTTMPENRGAIRFYRSHGFEDEAVYLERHL